MSMQRLESTQDKARKKTKISDSREEDPYISDASQEEMSFPPFQNTSVYSTSDGIEWTSCPVAFNVNVFILFNNHACFFTIPSSTTITIDTLILCTTISTHTETRQQGSK